MRWLWCLGIVGAFTIGCGDAGTGRSLAAPQGSFSIKWGPTEVPAGNESTECVVRRLGNPAGTFIHEIQNVLGATSHHFIVYRVNDTVEQLDPQPCQPFLDVLEDPPLIITQRAEDRLVLPEGIAYELEPDQMIRLELHYVNPSAAPQMAEATSTFVPMPAEEVTDLADVMFLGDVNINIPPTSLHTVGPTYIQIPERFNGVNYFAITGHEHQWGTNVFVEATPDPGSPGTAVYDVVNFSWDEPETVTYDPPFQLPDGGGFNLTCDWNNQSGNFVGFGTGVDDEMCFFWAYYFPSQGPLVLF
ncbi:MAG: hypothetical protein AAF500_03270 [Myxococcota bacterium]